MSDPNEYEVQRSLGRIEGGISEVKSSLDLLRNDHAGLRAEFNKLEAGRLTRLESAFASSEAVAHSKAKNTAAWTSGIVASAITVVGVVLQYFLK